MALGGSSLQEFPDKPFAAGAGLSASFPALQKRSYAARLVQDDEQ